MYFNKKELQWIYDTVDKTIMQDNYDLTCDHCPDNSNTPCREAFCSNIKRELMIMINNFSETE